MYISIHGILISRLDKHKLIIVGVVHMTKKQTNKHTNKQVGENDLYVRNLLFAPVDS